MRCFLINR